MIRRPPRSTLFPLHDALPIYNLDADDVSRYGAIRLFDARARAAEPGYVADRRRAATVARSEEHTSELQSLAYLVCRLLLEKKKHRTLRMINNVMIDTQNNEHS